MNKILYVYILLIFSTATYALECKAEWEKSKKEPENMLLYLECLERRMEDKANQNTQQLEQVDRKLIDFENKTSITSIENFPEGVILTWTNKEGNIPDGWAICDGTRGTPDLRGRFIMGGGSLAQIGEPGGRNNIRNLNTIGHTLTLAEIPAHNHRMDSSLNGRPLQWGPGEHPVPIRAYNQAYSGEKKKWTNGETQSHAHPLPEFDNRPEFFTVIFIMKL